MTEHFTRNTESVTRHCNFCGRRTQHSVTAGRVGRCMEHGEVGGYSKKQSAERDRRARKAEEQRQNPTLFP